MTDLQRASVLGRYGSLTSLTQLSYASKHYAVGGSDVTYSPVVADVSQPRGFSWLL